MAKNKSNKYIISTTSHANIRAINLDPDPTFFLIKIWWTNKIQIGPLRGVIIAKSRAQLVIKKMLGKIILVD